jgi:hypothetical protein
LEETTMPNRDRKPPEGEEDKEQLKVDQPSADDPDPREAITHPTDTYAAPLDRAYRPGDPPPGQAMFPPDLYQEKSENPPDEERE